MNTFEQNSYVMNNKTGKAYRITTDTVQTRNRHQVVGTGIRNPESTQIAASHLTELSDIASLLCFEAERIIRGKHKHTETDKQILAMHNALKKSIIK